MFTKPKLVCVHARNWIIAQKHNRSPKRQSIRIAHSSLPAAHCLSAHFVKHGHSVRRKVYSNREDRPAKRLQSARRHSFIVITTVRPAGYLIPASELCYALLARALLWMIHGASLSLTSESCRNPPRPRRPARSREGRAGSTEDRPPCHLILSDAQRVGLVAWITSVVGVDLGRLPH